MKRCAIVIFASLLSLGVRADAQSSGKIHELKSSPTTVHRGFYDATLKPVLTIDSGDRVRVWTTTGNPRYFENLGVSKEKIPAELYAAFEGVQDSERGDHTLIGPMYVNGAEPGDTLEIRILSVRGLAANCCAEFPPASRCIARGFSICERPCAMD